MEQVKRNLKGVNFIITKTISFPKAIYIFWYVALKHPWRVFLQWRLSYFLIWLIEFHNLSSRYELPEIFFFQDDKTSIILKSILRGGNIHVILKRLLLEFYHYVNSREPKDDSWSMVCCVNAIAVVFPRPQGSSSPQYNCNCIFNPQRLPSKFNSKIATLAFMRASRNPTHAECMVVP